MNSRDIWKDGGGMGTESKTDLMAFAMFLLPYPYCDDLLSTEKAPNRCPYGLRSGASRCTDNVLFTFCFCLAERNSISYVLDFSVWHFDGKIFSLFPFQKFHQTTSFSRLFTVLFNWQKLSKELSGMRILFPT